MTLIEVENPIVPYITQARVATTDAVSGASGYVREGVSRWIAFERKAERELRITCLFAVLRSHSGEIKTVLPADESLTPGIIYVLIAGLSGSVLTRTRAFPLRMITPPLFTLAAMPYFLPKTATNLRAYFSDLEDKYVPDVAEKHDMINSRLSMHYDMAKNKLGSAGEDASRWGDKAVKGIENSTGLRVGDVVRKGQERVQQQKEKMEGGLRVASGPVKMQTVGYVVETRPVAEIVAPVTAEHPANTINAGAAVERPTAVAASTPAAAVEALQAPAASASAAPTAAAPTASAPSQSAPKASVESVAAAPAAPRAASPKPDVDAPAKVAPTPKEQPKRLV